MGRAEITGALHRNQMAVPCGSSCRPLLPEPPLVSAAVIQGVGDLPRRVVYQVCGHPDPPRVRILSGTRLGLGPGLRAVYADPERPTCL